MAALNVVSISSSSAAALLPGLAAQQCHDHSFATDIDGAEKGVCSFVVELESMKRASAAGSSIPLHPVANSDDDDDNSESVQGTSSGTDAHSRLAATTVDLDAPGELEIVSQPSTELSISPSQSHTDKQIASHDQSEEGKPSSPDTGYDKFINRRYDTYPLGWSRLASFLNSADSFAIFRRFGTAHCRILLHLQCQITALEKQLDELDAEDSTIPERLYRLRRDEWYEGWNTAQKDLLDELQKKLSEYDDLLLKESSLRSLPRTPERDHKHIFNWIYGCKPVDEGQYDFILHHKDFVSTANLPRNANGFDDFVESCLSSWPGSRFNRFLRRDYIHGEQGQEVYFFSRAKISLVARLIAVFFAVTILLIPVFLLSLTDMSRKITSAMVFVFVLAFAVLISLFTGARAETVFIGTCTYCAVLVTFFNVVQANVAVVGKS